MSIDLLDTKVLYDVKFFLREKVANNLSVGFTYCNYFLDIKDEEKRNQLIHLNGWYNRITQDVSTGVLDGPDKVRYENQISKSLLSLLAVLEVQDLDLSKVHEDPVNGNYLPANLPPPASLQTEQPTIDTQEFVAGKLATAEILLKETDWFLPLPIAPLRHTLKIRTDSASFKNELLILKIIHNQSVEFFFPIFYLVELLLFPFIRKIIKSDVRTLHWKPVSCTKEIDLSKVASVEIKKKRKKPFVYRKEFKIEKMRSLLRVVAIVPILIVMNICNLIQIFRAGATEYIEVIVHSPALNKKVFKVQDLSTEEISYSSSVSLYFKLEDEDKAIRVKKALDHLRLIFGAPQEPF